MGKKLDKAAAAVNIPITGLRDAGLNAVARTVQNAVETAKGGRKSSDPSYHQLTRGALDTTLVWLEKRAKGESTPLDKLEPQRLELLTNEQATGRLDDLNQALAAAAASQTPVPLLRSMKLEAISNPDVRACAAAISEHYGESTTPGVLTFGEIRAAWEEITKSAEADFKPSKAFTKAVQVPEFTKKNVEALRIYLTLGLGNLTGHGTLEGYGIKCHRVFKLPLLPEVKLPDGKPYDQQTMDVQRAILQDNRTAYAGRFAKTGYDRIYGVGDDGALYVGIIDEGSLAQLPQHATLEFTDPMRPLQLGSTRQLFHMLGKDDVNNTKYEATIGFWSRTFAGWGESLNNIFRDATEKPVSAITAISEHLKPDPKAPAAAAGGTTPLFAAVGLAGLVAAIPNMHNLVTFVGYGAAFVGFAATGLSLWSLKRTGKDIGPFLDATGHVVNRAGIRSDEL